VLKKINATGNPGCTLFNLECTISAGNTLRIGPADLLTTRGVAHLVDHGTSGLTTYETIPHVRLETSGGVLSTVDMVVQRRNGPRRLRDDDDDDDDDDDYNAPPPLLPRWVQIVSWVYQNSGTKRPHI